MTEIEVFQFPATGQQVRTVLRDGEPWFVGRDVTDALGVDRTQTRYLRVFAGQLGVGEKTLREWMVTRKLIYRREVEQRWSRSQQQMVPVYQWLAYAEHADWFTTRDQPTAPRMHNGQMATTLYVTPLGKVAIRRLLMKHPIDSAAA